MSYVHHVTVIHRRSSAARRQGAAFLPKPAQRARELSLPHLNLATPTTACLIQSPLLGCRSDDSALGVTVTVAKNGLDLGGLRTCTVPWLSPSRAWTERDGQCAPIGPSIQPVRDHDCRLKQSVSARLSENRTVDFRLQVVYKQTHIHRVFIVFAVDYCVSKKPLISISLVSCPPCHSIA